MKIIALLMWFLPCLALADAANDLQLARQGSTDYVIVQGENPIPAEKFAAEELSRLLQQITGAVFPVHTEDPDRVPARAIYVGHTRFAADQQINLSAVGPDHWYVRSVGEQLILCGGRPRGTIYAVQEFLEQELGCRWFDPDNQILPAHRDLKLSPVRKNGEPLFRERNIYTQLPATPADDLFRTRMMDTRPKSAKFGFGYGLGTHTAWTYSVNFPEDQPEWLALNAKGERPRSTSGHGPGQICLTHPGARDHVLQQLRERIRKNQAEVKESSDGREPQRIFAINQNDIHFICQCPACQALSASEEADSGVLVDFINALADQIITEFPEVTLETWAYANTIKPPKQVRPRENVLIRVIQLNGEWSNDARGKKNWEPAWYPDLFRPRSHPVNLEATELLLQWSRMSSHLGIWGYWLQYNEDFPSPYLNLRNIHQELKLYKDCKVKSIFIENEGAQTTSFFALKNWVGWKLMQDPDQELLPLTQIFMDGYYRKAAGPMRDYMNLLEDSIAAVPPEAGNLSALKPAGRLYLTPAFFRTAQTLLDQAESACPADSPERLNVRRERIPVDAALYAMWGLLDNQLAAGEKLPWERPAIRLRYEQYRGEQMQKRGAPGTEQELQDELQKLDKISEENLSLHIVPPPGYGRDNLLTNGDFSEGVTAWEKNATQRAVEPRIDTSVVPAGISQSLRFSGSAGNRVFHTQTVKVPAGARKLRLGGWLKTEDLDHHWEAMLQVVVTVRSPQGQTTIRTHVAARTPYQNASMNWSFFGRDFDVDGEVLTATVYLLTGHPGGEAVQDAKPNTGTAWFADLTLEVIRSQP